MAGESDREKLKSLAERIARAEKVADRSHGIGSTRAGGSAQSKARVVRIGTDFLATVLGSLGLGWFVDQQLSIAPWAMIGFLVVGTAMACWKLALAALKPTKDAQAPSNDEDKQTGANATNGTDPEA